MKKILVTVKRVEDPQIKIKVKSDKTGIETEQMKYVVNPFDEIAIEEALRLGEVHKAEVVVCSVGDTDCAQQLRTALAMGAERAIHVVHDNSANIVLDPWIVALALQQVVQRESPDLIILGKQAIDDDMGQTGIVLAELLGFPQATFASKEASLESAEEKNKTPAFKINNDTIEVLREVDGGMETIVLTLPAIITTELRLNIPRYASLPGIMKAKKKEIKEIKLTELVGSNLARTKVLGMEAPKQRLAGAVVGDVATLVQKLRNEAKAI